MKRVARNIVRGLVLVIILYGMIVSWKPMGQPIGSPYTGNTFDGLFLIPGLIGWCIAALAGMLIVMYIITQPFIWLFKED